MDMVNSMLISYGLTENLWGEAILSACFILNRITIRENEKTPYEIWKKRVPNVDDYGRERAIYYLSKRMLEYETRYIMIELFYLALLWATQRLRHYMIEYSVQLVSLLDSMRYLFDMPVLTSRLMRWLVLLIEFDIQYVTQKSTKGSVLAIHLASLPVTNSRVIDDDFSDKAIAGVTSLSSWRVL